MQVKPVGVQTIAVTTDESGMRLDYWAKLRKERGST